MKIQKNTKSISLPHYSCLISNTFLVVGRPIPLPSAFLLSNLTLSSLKEILQVPQRNLQAASSPVPTLPHRQNLSSSILHDRLGLPCLSSTWLSSTSSQSDLTSAGNQDKSE